MNWFGRWQALTVDSGTDGHHALSDLVHAVRQRRDTLAWLFADYDLELLCARLQCEPRVALRVQLAPRPRLDHLDLELAPLAMRLGISAARLMDLVREAESRRRAFSLARTVFSRPSAAPMA